MTIREMSEGLASVVRSAGKSIVRVEGGRTRPASGIAWDDRHVLTVARAVTSDRARIAVGASTLEAKVKGRDETTDLAILEVEGELASLGAAPATFEEPGAIEVGQLAIRLARPGHGVQASLGIVSALGREPYASAHGGEIDRYLSSDAEHRAGFSGGALASIDGKLLGLTSTGLVRGRSVNVPIETLRRVVQQLLAHGKVRESYLGLLMRPTRLPQALIDATGEQMGLFVLDVDARGPGAASGLRYGDTVLHLGDDSVRTVDDVWRYLRTDRAGQAIPVKVWRNDQLETISVTLAARPS